MEAGRELDAEIAEKVMGWKWWRRENPITGQKWLAESAAPHASMVGRAILCEAESDLTPEVFDGPDYSRSIAAAWTVVAKLRELGFLFSAIQFEDGDWEIEFHAQLGLILPGNGEVAHGKTAEAAICKAALKAVAA